MKTKPSLNSPFIWITTGLRSVATRILIIQALCSALFALCPAPCALSQIPQGFNYQAIARDGSGNPITSNINVKIAILTSENDADVIWEEEHPVVTPDAHGLFSIVVGQGNDLPGGLASFSEIDWTVIPKYIRTKINDVKLETSKVWSVPYAMVADSLGGPLNKLEVQASDGSSLDEALFLVKNKGGQTVFAVYNEGVRIFVGDGAVKGAKGGFSVGGFGSEKDEDNKRYLFVDDDSVRIWVNDLGKSAKGGFSIGGFGYTKEKPKRYFYANEDSVRIYIDDTGKSAKGGFSVGGFSQGKGYTSFLNVSTDASGIVYPAVNRILWYPLKNAFLTGRVLITDPVNVGENSIASGYEPKAKGGFSQAFGYMPEALGDYSTAIGKNAHSGAPNSFSFGEGPQATAANSYAFGAGAVASGVGSFAFGSAGMDTTAAPTTALTTASGINSIAIGQGSVASATGSVSMGMNNISGGAYSSSVGFQNTASGRLSSSFGTFSTAQADNSSAMGQFSNATGIGASAFGNRTIASGWDAVALGAPSHCIDVIKTLVVPTEAFGAKSVAIGHGVKAQSFGSVVIGDQNVLSDTYNTDTWVPTDPLFVVGNGYGATEGSHGSPIRSNALMILKNGNFGIGADSPVEKLEIGGTTSKIYLNSASSNTVIFNPNGVDPPTITTRSAGTKIVLYPSVTDFLTDYAIGIAGSTLWNSIPQDNSAYCFRYYAGTTRIMTIRGDKNLGVGDIDPSYRIHVQGGAYCDGMTWTNASDRNLKENFEPVDGEEILSLLDQLPVTKWNYKSDDPGIRHISPVAQDFYGLFNIGNDDKSISSVDPSGIALAAIKELNRQNKSMKEQIESQQQQIDRLEKMISEMRVEIALSSR